MSRDTKFTMYRIVTLGHGTPAHNTSSRQAKGSCAVVPFPVVTISLSNLMMHISYCISLLFACLTYILGKGQTR